MEQDKPKRKTQSVYSKLSTSKFVTKGMDRKAWLDDRKKQIEEAAQKGKEDDDEDDDEETEIEKLEREAKKLESQLKRLERLQQQALDKQEKEKVAKFSKCIQEGKFLKQPKAVMLVKTKKKKKTLKMEKIRSADEEDK